MSLLGFGGNVAMPKANQGYVVSKVGDPLYKEFLEKVLSANGAMQLKDV